MRPGFATRNRTTTQTPTAAAGMQTASTTAISTAPAVRLARLAISSNRLSRSSRTSCATLRARVWERCNPAELDNCREEPSHFYAGGRGSGKRTEQSEMTNGDAATHAFATALGKVVEESVQRAIKPLEDKIDTNTRVLSDRIDQLSQRVGTLETKVEAVEGRMEAMESRMGDLEIRMESLDSRVETLEGSVSSLSGSVSSLDGRVEGIERLGGFAQS